MSCQKRAKESGTSSKNPQFSDYRMAELSKVLREQKVATGNAKFYFATDTKIGSLA